MYDTIASIATPLGIGAISIIRISGKDAIKIVNNLFKEKELEKVSTHTIHYGHIIAKNEIIDEVLISVMKSPKTYTREDVVEINCHGGTSSTNKVLELLLLNGCRLAEPGEFTKRAFLNGRIDLTEAEAVSDLIQSQTDITRQIALQGLNGNISKLIKEIRASLLKIISNIEVNIDYPEYNDIYEVTIKDIKEYLPFIKEKFTQLIKDYEDTKLLYKGINVVIIGRPNVGKSSLLNRLLDESKAIVTDIPGTTRDLVEGIINLDGIKLNLIDTAGIRKTNDVVESFGIEKSKEAMKNADLILLLLNGNEKLTNEDLELINESKNKTCIYIINKNDLELKLDISTLNLNEVISINTIDNEGITLLKNRIRELFNFDKIKNKDYVYITNLRQITKIKESLIIINEIINNIDSTELDILELDLKNIWNTLGLIIGESYDEELLDELFKNFCVGK